MRVEAYNRADAQFFPSILEVGGSVRELAMLSANGQRTSVLYFDHNATHPLLPAAREAWIEASERFLGNPSSPHRLGDRADRALGEAREQLAEWLGCAAHEIVWTSGATESNNTAIAHLAATWTGVALVSAIEHPCALESVRRYFPGRHQFIPATKGGIIDLDWLKQKLRGDQDTACVVVMAANNETGVLQPWQEVLAACRERNVPMLCDAAQWIGRLPLRGLGDVPLVSGCAHKFGGPPGVGFLKGPYALRPLIVGGPQEEGRRAGTENVPGVLAMIAALRGWVEGLKQPDFLAKQEAERGRFETNLKQSIPGIRIVGGEERRLWNTSAVVMPEARDCRQRWVVKLDRLGMAVSTGSACASGKESASHVLRAMGFSKDEAGRALRFSAGWNTTRDHWDSLRAALLQATRELA